MTTKVKILNYLKYRGLVSGTELESQAEAWRTKSSVISRRARELANDGLIERSVSDRKTVQYKHKQSKVFQFNQEQERVRQLITQERFNI